MPLWTLTTPPSYVNMKGEVITLIATNSGWVDPTTGHIYVAIRNLSTKAGAGDITSVSFVDTTLARGDDIVVRVQFDERVSTSSATLVLTNAEGDDVTLTADGDDGEYIVEFSGTVPSEKCELSLGDQTIGGTIVDTGSAIKAKGTLTLESTAEPADGDVVVIHNRTYTFKDTLTDVDGYVAVGSSAQASLDNLVHAINLTGTAGTTYADSMTVHATVSADNSDSDKLDMVVTAKVGGTTANSYDTTTTITDAAWAVATMAGGVAAVASDKAITEALAATVSTDIITISEALPVSVEFDAVSYAPGDALSVTVTYDYNVDVTAGAAIEITSTGDTTPITLYAAAGQSDTDTVVFDKQVDAVTAVTVPSETATLSIAAQDLVGTIVDAGTATDSGLTLTTAMAAAASTRSVKAVDATAIAFDAETYDAGDEIAVTVTFDAEVDVTAGASIVVTSTGDTTPITLYAAAGQSDTLTVVFDKQNDNTTPAVLVSETATLSVGAQTIGGTIVETGTAITADKTVTTAVAAATATASVKAIDATAIAFDAPAYIGGDEVAVTVTFDAEVDVTAGASLVLSSTGDSGDITLYAAAGQSDTLTVVFDKKVDNTTAETLPAEDAVYTVEAQTIGGTIVGTGGAITADKTITTAVGESAGSREVAVSDIVSVAFGAESYAPLDAISVIVTYDHAVNVTGGATMELTSTQGGASTIDLYAAEQLNTTTVVFDMTVDLETPAEVPDVTGEISIAAQSIIGTITDEGTDLVSDKDISLALATGAGKRDVDGGELNPPGGFE